MATKKPSNSSKTTPSQDIGSIISGNLKRLIKQNNTTQKELAEKLHVAEASMTGYCKGRSIPNVEFLVSLKNLYDISIDDFLTKSITPSSTSTSDSLIDKTLLESYRQYCGAYFVYYFDTSRYKGKDLLLPKESVLYGILYIYENPSYLSIPEFSCAAVLGIRNRDAAAKMKHEIDRYTEPSEVINYIERGHIDAAYFGVFELSQDHAFITMEYGNTDKALLILHRVDNKSGYTGGIGTINSVSKGRERTPVVQFMGVSRFPSSMSVEEIHHNLLLNYPTFSVESEAEEMIECFKTLYCNSSETKSSLSDFDKSIVVRSNLERYIRKSLERNVFRYGKISEGDDDEWYHAIKVSSIKE